MLSLEEALQKIRERLHLPSADGSVDDAWPATSDAEPFEAGWLIHPRSHPTEGQPPAAGAGPVMIDKHSGYIQFPGSVVMPQDFVDYYLAANYGPQYRWRVTGNSHQIVQSQKLEVLSALKEAGDLAAADALKIIRQLPEIETAHQKIWVLARALLREKEIFLEFEKITSKS